MNLTETQSAVLALIRRFIARQQLVFDALMDLRPHFVMFAGRHELTDEEGRQLSQLRLKYSREVPQKGYWGANNEWEYFVHGGGCRLVHTVTKEPIEWDASDIRRFDKFWLVNYLEWLFQQQTEDEWIEVLKTRFAERSAALPQGFHSKLHEFIFPLLEELSQVGILSEAEYNRYTLLDVSDSETDQL